MESNTTIAHMAQILKKRAQTQTKTLLFLGAKAGGLFRSLQLYSTLGSFGLGDLQSLTPLERYHRCYKILFDFHFSPQDIHDILTDKVLMQQIRAEVPEICVAELMKQDFFNPLLSVSIYREFEEAFQQVGMKELLDFEVVRPKSGASIPHIHSEKSDIYTLIKVFGDIASREYDIDRRVKQIEENESLKKLINDSHDVNVLIVGVDQIWDQHIIQALFPCSGSIWYVNDEEPAKDSALLDYLKDCKADLILGPDGHYENFFRSLCWHITGTIPTYQAALDTLEKLKEELSGNQNVIRRLAQAQDVPIAGADPIYQAVLEGLERLKKELSENQNAIRRLAQAQDVGRKEQVPPKPLEAKVQILYRHLPSGVLAYYDAQTMPLIKYEIENKTPEAVKVVLTAEIKGFSHPRIDTVEIPAQSSSVYYQLPRLDRQRIGTLTEFTLAPLHIHVTYLKDGVELLYNKQDFDVYLMARDVIRWAVPDVAKGAAYLSLFEHIAAWVTPRKDSVKAMLRFAVDYHPQKALVGYLANPDPEVARSQVKAIFQALKEVGEIAYVNSPFAIGSTGSDVVQTVRLPDESLREHQANCIDGTVLYASLMEQASLYPVIVMKTGHAFVGWKTWTYPNSYEFLETTMTLSHSFEQAYEEGKAQYRYLQEHGWFEREPFDSRGFARLLDIKELHDSGIFPME